MKFDPQRTQNRLSCFSIGIDKARGTASLRWMIRFSVFLVALAWTGSTCFLIAQEPTTPPSEPKAGPPDPKAELLALRTIQRLAMGDAFDAKLRQRIWTSGREVVGVGHYEQAGGGTGRFSLEMTIHDGDSRQSIRQISDGKLSWTRTQIGQQIAIGRVEIGRIDEFEREQRFQSSLTEKKTTPFGSTKLVAMPSIDSRERLPARLLVGGLVELLHQIMRDYSLRIGKGTVERQPVWILRGSLTEEARARILTASGRKAWAPLCPVEVRVAIAAASDANGFGTGLPIRFEFWSAPTVLLPAAPIAGDSPVPNTSRGTALMPGQEISKTDTGTKNDVPTGEGTHEQGPVAAEAPAGRLISLLEVYSIRRIEPSPEERFLFSSDDRAVTFTNETARYLDAVDR